MSNLPQNGATPNVPPFEPITPKDLPIRIAQINEAISAAINSRVANAKLKTQLVGLGCYAGLLVRLAEEDKWLETVIDHLMLERNQRYEERRVAIHMSAKNGVAPPFGRILSEIRSTATGGER